MEDTKSVKGIVKRGVTELVTQGLTFNDNVLDRKTNNYLASIFFDDQKAGVAFLDLSTGEFMTAQGSKEYVAKLFQGFNPAEVILSKAHRTELEHLFGDEYLTHAIDEWVYGSTFGYEKLVNHFNTNSLKGFGIEGMHQAIIAAGAVLHYLEETEHKEMGHILSISRIDEEKYVWLDKFTIRNLELVYAQHDGGVPLIDILDETITPMGSRLLKKWVVLPLKEISAIQDRLAMVSAFFDDQELLEQIRTYLKPIGDVERLISKVAVGRINPREMGQLKKALINTIPVKELLEQSKISELKKLADQINPCDFLLEKIDTTLKDDVPIVSNQGNIIKDGVDTELDELRKIAFSGKDYLVQIQQREVERTGIPSLKIAYNKVFGYYLEVSNAHKDKVPEEWIR